MSSHTIWTDLPKGDNDILECCAIRISTSSCVERRSYRSVHRPPVISTGTSRTPAMVIVCVCVDSVNLPGSRSDYVSISFSWILLFVLVRTT